MTGTFIASPNGLVSATLAGAEADRPNLPLLVCVHGGGCNGKYFDLKGSSTLKMACARGFHVMLLNRPGYGGNRTPSSRFPIVETAPLIRDFIDQVRAEHAPRTAGIAIIGHSIGGAIALTIASERGEWPLKSVAVAGIGDQSPFDVQSFATEGKEAIDPPPELTEALFFDPERSLKWQAVASLRSAAERWLVSELREVVERWPLEWRETARRIDIPVHLRLAEHERIWAAGEIIVRRMAAAFTKSPTVDAALLRGGGHLFEATRRASELVESQLDFIEACVG